MSLMVPRGPSWANCSTSLPATPTIGTFKSLTAGANDTPSTVVSLIANLTHDCEFLVLGFGGFFISGSNGSCMANILIDPAGGSSWSGTDLITGLIIGQTLTPVASSPTPLFYYFPLWIKSGSSIGVEAQTAHTANITTGTVVAYALGGNMNPASWWCGKTVEAIGTDTTTTQGTNHTAGNSGAYSSWTNFGSTTSAPCGAVQWAVQGTNTDTAQNASAYYFEFGVNSTRIGPNIFKQTSTSETGWVAPQGPIFCSLPAGTQLMVRGTCSGTAEALDVAAYVVM